MQTFQTLLAKKLSDALAKVGLPDAGEVTPATDRRFGDYQTNAALVLGKQRGENPRALAEKIVARLDVADLCEPPAVAGAGFINFTLRPDAIAKKTSEILRDKRLGVAEAELNQRIVVDFGSPNVAKPMHVGHIRSIVLGDALARIAQFLGHEVIRDNHIGDWGTQFGMVIYGWKNLLDRQSLRCDPLAEIVRIYKETNDRATRDPQVREACRQELVKLQAGDKENIDIWNECVAFSMQDFEQIYEGLGVRYDLQCGESFYNDRLAGVVERLLKSGVAEVSEDAVVVFFRDNPELADKPCIIRKRDGGFNYATTDLATVDYRINDLKADAIWYVVGAPQTLHFKQIFEIARREGYRSDFRHITFGSILGEDRKLMKTRSGENVPLRDLLASAGGPTKPLSAFMLGGYFGVWADATAGLDLRIGAALGARAIYALPARACGLLESARVARYLADESAGQCGPCVHGLDAIATALERLAAGTGGDLRRIERWTRAVDGRGACRHPDGAARFVESALAVFADETERHARGRCTGAHGPLLPMGRR